MTNNDLNKNLQLEFDFFYSDPHFGHANILKYCNRPFANVDEQTEEMIKRYNEVVQPHHHVLWMGDCFWWGEWNPGPKALLARLNGRKSVVIGNHDPKGRVLESYGFEKASPKLQRYLGDTQVLCCHYPPKKYGLKESQVSKFERHLKRLPILAPNEFLLHGHTHQTTKTSSEGYAIHVGVDSWNYRPVSIAEIRDLIENREARWNGEPSINDEPWSGKDGRK